MMNTHRFHICRLAQLIYIALKVQIHICVTPIYKSTFIRLGWLRVFICATVQDDPALGNSGFWSRTVAAVYQSLELLASSVETKESKDIWLWVWQWWRNLTVKNIITRMFSGTVKSRTFESQNLRMLSPSSTLWTRFCENCPWWILWTWRLWDWCKLWNCDIVQISICPPCFCLPSHWGGYPKHRGPWLSVKG